jgi:hypothetical protein
MTRLEEGWALAALEGFSPPGEAPAAPRAGDEVDYLGTLRAMASASTALGRLGLRLAVWLLATAPLWTLGRLTLLPSLPVAERGALLDRLLQHRRYAVRELCLLLKVVASMALLAPRPVQVRTHAIEAPGAGGAAPRRGVR